MSVLVTMQVGPVDWAKFKSATEWGQTQLAPGLLSSKVYRSEGDTQTVLIVEEWESHDAFHGFADRVGEEYNDRAGTGALNWQDNVWVLSDAPTRGS